MILRHSGSECCGSHGKNISFTRSGFGTLPGGLWLRTDGPLWTLGAVCPGHTAGRVFHWKCQLLAGTVTHRAPWRCTWGPGSTQGQSQAGPGLCWSWCSNSRAGSLALVFIQVLLARTHLVWEEPCSPALCATAGGCILLTVVQQKGLDLLWLWQMAQTWLFCLGQWVQTAFNMPWKSELLAPLLEKGGRKRQIQFYSIHNFNNKMLLYTALVLLHYSHPLPPEVGSWNII